MHLDQQIMAALLRYLNHRSDRHFTHFFNLINQHSKLNRNQANRYHPELFQEATQEAWLIFYRKNLHILLKTLATQGTAIAPKNATVIVTRMVKHLNMLIRNKNVDLWRKETFPKAA